MVAATTSGGDDGAQVRARGEPEEGEELGERVREVQGVRGCTREGKEASRRWPGLRARVRRARARPPGRGGRRHGKRRWWAGPASYSAGPVGGLRR